MSGYNNSATIKLLIKTLISCITDNNPLYLLKIIQDDDKFLCKKNHGKCGIGNLYKQKFFHLIINDLLANSSNDDILMTIICLLQYLPSHILINYFKQHNSSLMSLLLHTISTNKNVNILSSCIKTLLTLLSNNSIDMKSDMNIIIPILLQLSQQMNQAIDRINCISILILIAKQLAYHLIYPYQDQVINQLDYCINDIKKDVRKVAI